MFRATASRLNLLIEEIIRLKNEFVQVESSLLSIEYYLNNLSKEEENSKRLVQLIDERDCLKTTIVQIGSMLIAIGFYISEEIIGQTYIHLDKGQSIN